MLIAAARSQQISAARASDTQLEEALAQRELVSALDFVLMRSSALDIDLDPRLVALLRIERDERGERDRNKDMVEVLRQLLAGTGMELDVELGAAEEDAQDKAPAVAARRWDTLPQVFSPSLTPFELHPAKGRSLRVQVWPINAKPNLNLIDREPLEHYLRHIGVAAEAASRFAGVLIDWRDADDITTQYGAELDVYLPRGYRPRNAAIRSWQELVYLDGVTPALVRVLREHFVLYGQQGRIHLAHLAPQSLAALAAIPLDDAVRVIEQGLDAIETLPEQSARIIRRIATSQVDDTLWLVRIDTAHASLQALYSPTEQRLIEWTLDGIGPIPPVVDEIARTRDSPVPVETATGT